MYVEKSQRKISIIGTGAVGSAIAYAIMMRGLADKIVFIDTNKKLANAELLDIKHGLHNIPCAELVNGDYSDIKDSSIIIVTAGRSKQTRRRKQAGLSAGQYKNCCRNNRKYKNLLQHRCCNCSLKPGRRNYVLYDKAP